MQIKNSHSQEKVQKHKKWWDAPQRTLETWRAQFRRKARSYMYRRYLFKNNWGCEKTPSHIDRITPSMCPPGPSYLCIWRLSSWSGIWKLTSSESKFSSERSLPGMQIKTAIRKRRFNNARSDGARRRELWKPDARRLDGKREVICIGDIWLKKTIEVAKNTASA